MKKIVLTTLLSAILMACGGSETESKTKPTAKESDELQLAYIRLDQGTVSCRDEEVGQRAYTACRFISLGGNSAWQIWYYDNQKDPQKRFYALNGKARGTYNANFKDNPVLGDFGTDFGLPMPEDMKMDEIIAAFGE